MTMLTSRRSRSTSRRPRALAALVPAAALAALLGAATPALAATPFAGTSSADAATGGPTPAPRIDRPAPPAGLAAIKARAAAAIAARQAALAARLSLVSSGSPHFTAADRQALQQLISTDQSGLQALGEKIAADTDVATAQADAKQIFTGYRVYALALPQVRLVRANDTVTAVVLPKLRDVQARLTRALATAGKTDQAAHRMADLAGRITSIERRTTGASAGILALTPADWNADHGVLAAPRQALRDTRTDLARARADIIAVKAVLGS